ncbi:AAA family ATPase [Ectopseudomonas oleovorans]|uniref:AAA family ATPase n=1 Tax=Ectopseudomonas oleovorans TaxID=301 RepID=UPI0019D123FE
MGSIPITRSRQPSKSPVITDGAFSFLAFAGLDRKVLGRERWLIEITKASDRKFSLCSSSYESLRSLNMDVIEKLRKSLKSKSYEPFIRHIRFPHFKNLTPYLNIDFKFPITALVGPNGSNKSSILRAIACCPHFKNLSEYWFETDVDPIDESGGRPRYIFGYIDQHSNKTAEVIQTRISRPGKNEVWEPSRPLKIDGMETLVPLRPGITVPGRTSTRWAGIKKDVTILDFRSEISAFDKILYHGDAAEHFRKKSSKDILRQRSKHLRKVIREDLKSYRPFKGHEETVFSNELLPPESVKIISDIIGKEYSEIRLIEHSLLENRSHTAILKSKGLTYSEAFAGSGEFAVVMLVKKTMSAPPRSLIILDEPEVSLHPGAQLKLMDFLLRESLNRHHQIVISTHSKLIVDKLPPEAIVLLQPNPATYKITAQGDVNPAEAFFHLGQVPASKKKIFVEDPLACELVRKTLRILGPVAVLHGQP